MVLIQKKHELMRTSFIPQNMVLLLIKKNATERSSPDHDTQWTITQSKGFTRKGIENIRSSVKACIYLAFTSQV